MGALMEMFKPVSAVLAITDEKTANTTTTG